MVGGNAGAYHLTCGTIKRVRTTLEPLCHCQWVTSAFFDCAVAPAAANGSGRGDGRSAASDGVGDSQRRHAEFGMDRVGSGEPEGTAKLQHYAGRLSIGGRAHYHPAAAEGSGVCQPKPP